MTDDTGAAIADSNGNTISYMTFYETYAKNAGDTIVSLMYEAYPGIDTVNEELFTTITETAEYAPSIDPQFFSVTAINSHLSDGTTIEEIKRLHAQKLELESNLAVVRSEIETVIQAISSTDLTNQGDTSRANLSLELSRLYARRTELEKQIIASVNDINGKAASTIVSKDAIKYRIRGHISMADIEAKLEALNKDITLVGVDIQYKYKSISKDITVASVISGNTFTTWNRYETPLKERFVRWNKNRVNVEDITPEPNHDTIKWNQIDIPIT